MAKSAFFERDGNVYLDAPYMEGYVPLDIISDKDTPSTVACLYDEGIKMIGIFACRIFPSENTPRENVKLETFGYPNTIEAYPSDMRNEKLELFPGDDLTTYKVLRFFKGDLIMNANSKQDIVNCEKFLNLITKGKLPRSIPYDVAEELMLKNFKINGFNPKVPGIIIQLILSEMYRSAKNPEDQFRKVAEQAGSMYDGIWYNVNEVSALTNVLSSLSFERFSDKITSSLNMSKSPKPQNRTPLEKVITM